MTEIKNSATQDIEAIMGLYAQAADYQRKINAVVVWPQFDRALVDREINENRQWKIVEDGTIACVWATTFSDPVIWEQRNDDPSVYIHRIATEPGHRGRNYVQLIVEWATAFARQHRKKFVRMDTVGNNARLIDYYRKNGFSFLGMVELKNTSALPEHYSKDKVCLFEIRVE